MLTTAEILDIFHEMFILTVRLGAPILLISMILGIVISILQAATQIQEQTLTFVPKLIVVGLVLVIMGSSMLTTLQEFARQIFSYIAG